MLLLIVFLSCLFITIGAGLWASLSDFRGLVIPNSFSVLIAGSFAIAYGVLWLGGHQEDIFAGITSHLLAGLLIFGITAALFATNVIGGADSKLATVFALWMGLGGLMPFLFYMSVVGGLLGIAALVLRKWRLVKNPGPGGWIARVQDGESKVPYGIAIAAGALASFVKLGYFDMEALRSLLV